MTEQKSFLTMNSMLDLYMTEKKNCDPLEDFPSFSNWRDQYVADRQFEMDNTSVDDIILMDEDSIIPVIKVQHAKKKGLTSMDKARTIFDSMVIEGNLPIRKEVIDRFMKELSISKACASTYNHNIRQKFI